MTIEEGNVATIRDVAKVAGVSIATVSRVLNKPQAVRGRTRLRVQRVIDELNYHPDPSARRLSMGRTFTIGVVLPFLTRPSFVERLRGIEAALSHSEYDMVLFNVESKARRDAYFKAILYERRFDGHLIMALDSTHKEGQEFHDSKKPIVLVDTSHPLLPSVDTDNVAGGRLAAEHLLAKGYRQMAFLGDAPHELLFRTCQERLAGFQAALSEHQLTLRDENIFFVPHSRRAARSIIGQLFARPQKARPTAIFASTDTTALGLLDGLREHNLKAPDNLALIGFDDLETAELYDLTTIRQSLFESGVLGVQSLLNILEHGPSIPPPQMMLPLQLIERGTT